LAQLAANIPFMRRAVFLDRDGVLNEAIVKDGKPYPPQSVPELQICRGAPEACADLKRAGFLLVVVTNQPDVARGTQERGIVEAMNRRLARAIDIDEFRVCYHDDAQACECRKPKPGLLLAAARKWSIDLHDSFMLGDRWRDIDAGIAAGCRTVFIDRGYHEGKIIRSNFTASSLREAVDWILKQ
jgi:D-glycero-D-manno-heptose 1,7-bisphosphate phosphatase